MPERLINPLSDANPCMTLQQLYDHEKDGYTKPVERIKSLAERMNRFLTPAEEGLVQFYETTLEKKRQEYEAYGVDKKVWQFYKLSDEDPCE